MIFYSFFIVLITAYLFIVFKRAKKYKYDTASDYIYNLQAPLYGELTLTNNSLVLPQNHDEFDTLFLKLSLDFSPLSLFFKPFIKLGNTKHFFEYGAKGIRYLNISHHKEKNITLTCKHLKLQTKQVTLYGYKNEIDLSKKILILAPHADDAEIAAFGLYKSAKDVTIVTTTIGEHGVCNYCDLYKNKTTASLKKAELRTFDALCVPMLGGVDISKSLTLGYFGGSLKWMSEHPKELASSLVKDFGEIDNYRKVSHASITLPLSVIPRYDSFLNDLEQILLQTQPAYIITSHPAIDSHPDHKYTTYALLEILNKLNLTCKLLTYTNHLQLSETYPLGQMHSSITLPPNKTAFYFDSIYSFELDISLQNDKFFALEAIHDLRDSLVFISINKAYKQFNRMFKRVLSGKDKSYYKRAVRSNELFFIVESEHIKELQI